MGRPRIYSGTKTERRRQADEKYYKKYYNTINGHIATLVKSIKQRCNDSKIHNYSHYGGRGIKLCFTRIELLDWLKENGIDPRGLDIHRIDNDGDYTLSNIMFLTNSKHKVLHKGEI